MNLDEVLDIFMQYQDLLVTNGKAGSDPLMPYLNKYAHYSLSDTHKTTPTDEELIAIARYLNKKGLLPSEAQYNEADFEYA
ncbi:MAG: hypothetical protein FWE01_00240 [Firmicutes bacterium]|nr:hypothetical protein [Bacillota bacterium]